MASTTHILSFFYYASCRSLCIPGQPILLFKPLCSGCSCPNMLTFGAYVGNVGLDYVSPPLFQIKTSLTNGFNTIYRSVLKYSL